MGYACPVCEAAQRDGEHLAHHLAFTAMLHDDGHEEWLDEHVDDWGDRTPGALAAEVTPHAEEVETADKDGREHDHGHDHEHEQARPDLGGAVGRGGHDQGDLGRGGSATGVGQHDPEVEAVLQEARELTEQMIGDPDELADTVAEAAADDTDNGDDGSDTDGDATETEGDATETEGDAMDAGGDAKAGDDAA